MAQIVLLALAAAVSQRSSRASRSRPQPRRLPVAFYAGGLIVSIAAGIVVLNAFKRGDSVVGNPPSSPNPEDAFAHLGQLFDEYRGLAGSYRSTVSTDEEACGCRT